MSRIYWIGAIDVVVGYACMIFLPYYMAIVVGGVALASGIVCMWFLYDLARSYRNVLGGTEQ